MSGKVLDLVRGNGVSLVESVYTKDYDIVEHNPFDTEDPMKLDFPDKEFTGVFSYSILNAYGWRDSMTIVKEWARVLDSKGVLHILVPSQRWLGKLMMQHTIQPAMRPLLFGDQSDYTGSLNMSCYGMLDLRVHIEACGLQVVTAKSGQYTVDLGGQRYDAEQLYIAGLKD
jgi:hypothetical protein